ncbi:MAG: V-type ATP synthase subunit E [Deltaproteobacteria bacterium ADurb.BinA179]|nr:V-type ATP synthase subunit E [Deltaproteobacteria bacterium]MDI9543041.1 V-type ATP synthase subunit E [Pseudomonadota bacterium]OPZ29623.1 MAG: V-type ATP synthase subunit E [Deltaproteobacteria bacterium ADurb.BinA179]HOD70920.1 V-type ATP synthase subunit E [Deltaproteobacteria bacterium]HON62360.1 V-type ATP synthase subunit E [Deltaproteobacteria bacterium]
METPKMREAILSKARQEAQILIDEAKSKAGEVVGKAQEQWERRLEAEKKRLLSESRRGAARIIAQADLKARQEILKEKDSIIREMIGKVKERLTENTSETSTLERLITEAVDAFESDQALKIMASGKDIKRVREIVAASPVLKDRITGVSEAACMGGVICESVDGKVSVDNTYDTRLQMLIPRILPQVGKVLFGEHER